LGTWGSQVQILPLRPTLSQISVLLTDCFTGRNDLYDEAGTDCGTETDGRSHRAAARNLEASIASQQRIAIAIVAMPKDRRAAGIAKARRIFEDTIKEHGIDGEAGRTWVASMVQGIEILVTAIEASGGDGGGTA
jgi:hypothetical protein